MIPKYLLVYFGILVILSSMNLISAVYPYDDFFNVAFNTSAIYSYNSSLCIAINSSGHIFDDIESMIFNSTINNYTKYYLNIPRGIIATDIGYTYLLGTNATTNGTFYIDIGNDGNKEFYITNKNLSLISLSENNRKNLTYAINKYLSTCTYVNNNCTIPINIYTNITTTLNLSGSCFNNEGFILNSITYQNNTFETSIENFQFNATGQIDIFNGTGNKYSNLEFYLEYLSYYFSYLYDLCPSCYSDPINYPYDFIFNITYQGNDIIGNLNLSIPYSWDVNYLPVNFDNVTFDLNADYYYNISDSISGWVYGVTLQRSNQIINKFLFSQCNSTTKINILNYTILDEKNQTKINSTMQGTFYYWLGDGTYKKNYTINQQYINQSNYGFCISNGTTIKLNTNLLFTNSDYYDREYYSANSYYENSTVNNINIYMLLSSYATKFFFTLKNGVNDIKNGIIAIAKFYEGENIYKTIGIRKSDDSGKFIEYLELDKSYKLFVYNSSGNFMNVISRNANCQSTPCTLDLNTAEGGTDIFSSYNDTYLDNVNIVSSLTYDNNTKIVTYTFVDTTGITGTYRLIVEKNMFNLSTYTICNVYAITSSGVLICNLTGQSGDFSAKAYKESSAGKIDKIISIVISSIKDSLGSYLIIFSIGIILTLIFASAVLSGGNPSVILFTFGFSITALKLMDLFPFSWIIITMLDLLCLYSISRLKT